jgi:hypothetical protein
MEHMTTGETVRFEWRLMAEMRKENPGLTAPELAKALGRNAVTVRAWMRNTDYVRYENGVIGRIIADSLPPSSRAEATVKEVFQSHAADLQMRLLDIIDETNDHKLQASLIHDWLDRSGHAARQPAGASGATLSVSQDVLLALITRARESGLPVPLANQDVVSST